VVAIGTTSLVRDVAFMRAASYFLPKDFPVLAAEVGSFKDEIVVGKAEFVLTPEDPLDIAPAIEPYSVMIYADNRLPAK
jgi:hypothetical protein